MGQQQIKMQVLDCKVKNRDQFDSDEDYERYVDENWMRIIIHNQFVQSFQIDNIWKFVYNQSKKQIMNAPPMDFSKILKGGN